MKIKLTLEQRKEVNECIKLMNQPNRWEWVKLENEKAKQRSITWEEKH
jgi:hypothetical protein